MSANSFMQFLLPAVPIQQMRQVRLFVYLQPSGNPRQRRRRFPPQALLDTHFFWRTLALGGQG